MNNKKIVVISSKELLDLLKGKEVMVLIKEVYWDLDAQDYLSTGNEEYVNMEVEE